MFEHARRMDLEGIVSKCIGSRYVSGQTRAWLTLLRDRAWSNAPQQRS